MLNVSKKKPNLSPIHFIQCTCMVVVFWRVMCSRWIIRIRIIFNYCKAHCMLIIIDSTTLIHPIMCLIHPHIGQVMEEMGNGKTSQHMQGCFQARHPKCTSNLCWCCHGDVHTCGSTLEDCQAQCSKRWIIFRWNDVKTNIMYESGSTWAIRSGCKKSSVELFSIFMMTYN
jgi:hypothetical protein